MSERDLYKKVILYGLLASILISIISWFMFNDIKIVGGIMIGAVSRIIGFLAIIQGASNVLNTGKSYLSTVNYVGRLMFYGIIIFFALKNDFNVFALLIGFTIINIVVYIMQFMIKKGA